jgi:flagellar protein FlaI
MIEALDIVSIQALTYVSEKKVRRNTEIAEIVGLDPYTRMIRTTTIFQWDSVKDLHVMIGSSKALEEIRKIRGWTGLELQRELERRKQVIEFMVKHNIRDFKSVSNIIHSYQTKPENVLKRMDITV